MVNYIEILRLKKEGYSLRQIQSSVHSTWQTVRDTINKAEKLNLTYPLDTALTNEVLELILFPGKHTINSDFLEPDFEHIHTELAKSGVTLTLMWEEYRHKAESFGKRAYMPTQFGDKYRAWAKITKATMRIHHKPGDAIEIDWAGQTLPIYDSVTGETTPAYLFIAVLPCSGYAYAEVTSDMALENWLGCHINAFEYFGGVSRLLIPDNLKTGVTKNTRYETVINRSYQELAEYYGTAVVPARVEHPKDKSHAEATVRLASTWILAALRNEHFFTLMEAKAAVRQKLDALNQRPFTGKEGCRLTAYLHEEKSFMKPLPASRYELAIWRPNLSVGSDYLVSDGINKYSVPFDLIGEKVDMRLTRNTVEVFFKGSRVASHMRVETVQREPVVNPDHMPQEHRKYLNYNTDDFIMWAKSVGKSTERTVRYFLTAGKEAEQGFKACVSLNKLGEKYGNKKLEMACISVLSYTSSPSVRLISTALKNISSKAASPKEDNSDNSYGITRGVAYYSKLGKDGDSK